MQITLIVLYFICLVSYAVLAIVEENKGRKIMNMITALMWGMALAFSIGSYCLNK